MNADSELQCVTDRYHAADIFAFNTPLVCFGAVMGNNSCNTAEVGNGDVFTYASDYSLDLLLRFGGLHIPGRRMEHTFFKKAFL